jgi:hypothetical protein
MTEKQALLALLEMLKGGKLDLQEIQRIQRELNNGVVATRALTGN